MNAGHHHERWQLLPNARGGFYCGACGADVEPDPELLAAAVELVEELDDQVVDEHGYHDGTVPHPECPLCPEGRRR